MKEKVKISKRMNDDLKEELLASLPWEREINSSDISHALKKLRDDKKLRGVSYNLGSQDRCIKIFMVDMEEIYAGKLFTVRIDGSERFWNKIDGVTIGKPQVKVSTSPVVSIEVEVPAPSMEKESEEIPEEVKTVTTAKTKKAVVDMPAPPSREEMLKAYLCVELLLSGPVHSSEIKIFSQYMGWKIPIYAEVNRVLKYYGVKNTVDTSGKRIIKLTPEVERSDEDLHILITMLEAELTPIPEEITYFIETGECLKKEDVIPVEEERTSTTPVVEEKKEDKKEAEPIATTWTKEEQIKFLKKFIHDNGGGMFQSEVFRAIKLFHLNEIKIPTEDMERDEDVRIRLKHNSSGICEYHFQLTKRYYEKYEAQEEPEEVQEETEVEEIEVKKEPQLEKPRTIEFYIEFYSVNELNTSIGFKSVRRILQIWKYGFEIKSRQDALDLIKLYYSNMGNIEFEEDTQTVLKTLDNIVLG